MGGDPQNEGGNAEKAAFAQIYTFIAQICTVPNPLIPLPLHTDTCHTPSAGHPPLASAVQNYAQPPAHYI